MPDELLALLNWCADRHYIVGFERLDPSPDWGASLAWGGTPADYADARGATPLDALRAVMRERGWTPPDA